MRRSRPCRPAASGVRVGQPVRSPEGLLGRVLEAGRWASRIMLVSDGASSVPVRSLRNNVPALAVGRGDGLVELRTLEVGQNPFRRGDLLVTSGIGGIFPPNVPVARVIRLEGQLAIARPLADPARVDLAIVQPAYQPAATGALSDAPPPTATGPVVGPPISTTPPSRAIPLPPRAIAQRLFRPPGENPPQHLGPTQPTQAPPDDPHRRSAPSAIRDFRAVDPDASTHRHFAALLRSFSASALAPAFGFLADRLSAAGAPRNLYSPRLVLGLVNELSPASHGQSMLPDFDLLPYYLIDSRLAFALLDGLAGRRRSDHFPYARRLVHCPFDGKRRPFFDPLAANRPVLPGVSAGGTDRRRHRSMAADAMKWRRKKKDGAVHPAVTESSQTAMFGRRTLMIGAGQAESPLWALAGRMGYIAIAENQRYADMAEDNRVQMRLIPPRRGWIVDRHGHPMAVNRSDFRVDLTPDRIEDKDKVIGALTRLLELSPEEVARIREELEAAHGFQPVPVAEHLPFEKFAAVSLRLPELPGVSPLRAFSRYYPEGSAVGHLIGYVGTPNREEYEERSRPPAPLARFQDRKEVWNRCGTEASRPPRRGAVEVTARAGWCAK